MKKRILYLSLAIFTVIIYSCKDYEFNNPVDPEVPVNNPNGLTLLNFSETQLKISWVDKTTFPEGTQKVVQFEKSTDGTNYTVAGYDTVTGNQAELNTLFEPDKEYKFRTFVYYSDKKTVLEGTLTGILALKPDSLKAIFDSDTTALLTWKDKSTYEKEFEIDVYENNNKVKTETVNANTVSTKINYNYVLEKDYKFELKAKSENQNSTILSLTKRFTINAPTNLQITNFIESEADLTWKDNSSLETGYEIEQSEDGTNYAWVKTVGANIQTATITGQFNVGKTYSFRVRAKTNHNVSNYSNNVSLLVQFNAPTNLQIDEITDTHVKLSWEDNSTIETGFEVYKSDDGTNFTWVQTVGTNIQSATINGQFNIGKTYSFKVRAKTDNNVSNYSNNVNYFIQFDAPTNLQIDEITNTKVKLSWIDNSTIETGFEIYKSEDGTNYNLVKTVNSNVNNSEILGNFIFGISVYLKVRAKTNYYFTSFSNVANCAYGLPEMIIVQGGTFMMGSTTGRSDEQPVHSVTLSTFKIAKYEVTQKLWVTVMGSNPSYFPGEENRPVEQVSWNDVQQFITKLNQLTGKNYRLPTEAEWEYAARGGNQSQGYTYAGSNDLNTVAWYSDNSGNTTHPVGTKAPNELGLYDMSGNVCEWCKDWYSDSYYSISPGYNPPGPNNGYAHVLRSNSCMGLAMESRCASRGANSIGTYDNGFRLAIDIE